MLGNERVGALEVRADEVFDRPTWLDQQLHRELVVGDTIRRGYDCDLAAFLGATANSGTVFGDIRRLLDTQLERLTPAERDVLTRLALERP